MTSRTSPPKPMPASVRAGLMIVRYLNHQQSMGRLSPATVSHRRRTLRNFDTFVGDVPLERLTHVHVENWIGARGRSAATKRQYLTVARAFSKWLVVQKHLKRDFTQGIAPARVPRRIPRALTAVQVRAVLNACETPRDRLCVLLMAQEGLRVGEVATVQTGDIDRARLTMRIVGKGGHERSLPLSDETMTAITLCHGPVAIWIAGPLVRNHHDGYSPLSPHTITLRVSMLMKNAGVAASAHALRHTAASDVLDACGDVVAVKDMLGHSTIAVTQVYLRNTNGARLREAMAGRRYGGSV